MSHGRPPRKPRWQATPDTMVIAKHRASKPKAEDMATVTDVLQASFDALRTGLFTELELSILRGAIDTARSIERQGVVKGLISVFDDAEEALDSIWPRIVWTGDHGRTALYYRELHALRDFVAMHIFQCRQLSRAEYLRAVESARGVVGKNAVVLYGSQAREATA